MGLPGQSSSNVLMEKTDDIMLFWVKIRRVGTTGSHDSQRESQNHKGSHDHPVGGGMLGNCQQNSRILILSIYSLSNIYQYLL